MVGKEPCPKCGSKDNLKRYADGHGHCFTPGCGHHEPPDPDAAPPTKASVALPEKIIEAPPGAYETPLKSRGIEAKTLRRFRYFPIAIKGKQFHVAHFYDQDGDLAFQKLRDVATKAFPLIRVKAGVAPSTVRMFGMDAWPVNQKLAFGQRRVCCLTEGEIDAMSIAQATDFKFPVYSPPLGAGSARNSVAANLAHLDQFDEIIIAFDNDDAGRLARDEVIRLLPIEKVRLATYPEGFKDANDLIMAKKPGTLALTIESAQRWTPPGTISGSSLVDLLVAQETEPPQPSLSWPWPVMDKRIKGSVRKGDVILLLAGSGVGKSTNLHECMAHWLDQGLHVGTLCFEDTPVDVLNGIVGVAASRRLRLDPLSISAKVKAEIIHEHGWADRLFIEDPDITAKSKETLYAKIKYLATTRGVDVIVVDPLSYLVSKSTTDHDERRGIDHLMTELPDLARSLGINIVLSHHVTRPAGDKGHEDGAQVSLKQARGSHALGMYSALCIALEASAVARLGDGQPGPTRVTILKSRWRGELRGHTVTHLAFDIDTGRLVEVPPPVEGRQINSSIDDAKQEDSDAPF